eukprot:UN19129
MKNLTHSGERGDRGAERRSGREVDETLITVPRPRKIYYGRK